MRKRIAILLLVFVILSFVPRERVGAVLLVRNPGHGSQCLLQ